MIFTLHFHLKFMQNHIVCADEKHFHKHKSTLYSNVKPQDKKFLFVFTLAFHYLCLMENTPNIYAACFSPTGRTNLLVQRIAHNISCLLQNRTITDWNFTLPIQRNTPLQSKVSVWVIVGLPRLRWQITQLTITIFKQLDRKWCYCHSHCHIRKPFLWKRLD